MTLDGAVSGALAGGWSGKPNWLRMAQNYGWPPILPDMIQKNCFYAFSGASSRQLRDERFDDRRERFLCATTHLPIFRVSSKTFQCGDLSKHDRTLLKDNKIEASMGPTVGLATVVLFVAAARKGVEPALNLATEKESQQSF